MNPAAIKLHILNSDSLASQLWSKKETKNIVSQRSLQNQEEWQNP